jgi:hypothetical protein
LVWGSSDDFKFIAINTITNTNSNNLTSQALQTINERKTHSISNL